MTMNLPSMMVLVRFVGSNCRPWLWKKSLLITDKEHLVRRFCVSSQESVNLINDSTDSTPDKRPVSRMGIGDPKTARRWRYVLKKAIKVQSEKKNAQASDDLPIILKMQYDQSPELFAQRYPDAARLILKDKQLATVCDEGRTTNDQLADDQTVQYPFHVSQTNLVLKNESSVSDGIVEEKSKNDPLSLPNEDIDEVSPSILKTQKSISKLIKHLEKHSLADAADFDELKALKEEVWRINYGSPNPSIPASNIPCGGCGSLLHCQDTAVPGYIPYERFKDLKQNELRKEKCQRCLFLQHYNIALNVTVTQEDYPKILSSIQQSRSLVILLVDLTDFPCSIWPGIMNLVGSKKPFFVIGNKVDLLPRDSKGYLDRIKASLEQNVDDIGLKSGGNLLHIGLISAKTGFGIESLINKLHKHWETKGDVHIVGCTNVGKSTLFNTLLQSDYCKVQASDIVERATTSVWPGTTLNLLKFPILRPSGWNKYVRVQRLQSEQSAGFAEEQLRSDMYRRTKDAKYATLIGRIGMSFKKATESHSFETAPGNLPKKTFNPQATEFKDGKFCYDTPGAVYKDQILDLLTVDELTKTLPKEIIHPRTFSLRPDQTLFLAGLARIDMIALEKACHSLLLTFFSSPHLPVHVLPTEDADLFYKQNLGTRVMGIPMGTTKRLAAFPKLEGKEFEFVGIGYNQSCADVVLSSAGWCAISTENGKSCTIKVYTPACRGIYIRNPSVLPFAVKLRGLKIRGTPAYKNELCCSLE